MTRRKSITQCEIRRIAPLMAIDDTVVAYMVCSVGHLVVDSIVPYAHSKIYKMVDTDDEDSLRHMINNV